MRALAYSLLGMFDKALADYDEALKIKPDFPLALNNRAWAYFKLGRPHEGLADVEHALRAGAGQSVCARHARAHPPVTRATARRRCGLRARHASGGERIVKMYQCGLRSQGLYFGALDGVYSPPCAHALRTCMGNRYCDPLPSNSECRPEVS